MSQLSRLAYHKSINQFIIMFALLHQGQHLVPEGLHLAGQHLVARPHALRLSFQLLQLCLEGVPLTGQFLELEHES